LKIYHSAANADAQQRIDSLLKRIEAAKNAQQLNARQNPTELKSLQFNIQGVFEVLAKELLDVAEGAEAVVKAHLARHGKEGMEDWVSRGQEYLTSEECPFCGQGIVGLDLIKAYRSHFNEAYADLKRKWQSLKTKSAQTSQTRIDTAVLTAETNKARMRPGRTSLNLDPFP
jgi:wobble nucleotide-excising tRNase